MATCISKKNKTHWTGHQSRVFPYDPTQDKQFGKRNETKQQKTKQNTIRVNKTKQTGPPPRVFPYGATQDMQFENK